MALPLPCSTRDEQPEQPHLQSQEPHTIKLSPEVIKDWARLIDQQKTVGRMVEATVGFGFNKLLEPGKQEMLAAFADPNNKPIGRFLALVGAMGVQAVQNQIDEEIKATAKIRA